MGDIKKICGITQANTVRVGNTILNIDAQTKLLLHLDNNVTDSSIGAKTVINTNVTFSTETKKFGTHSAIFNGTNATLSLADSDDWNFGSGDFTIDFWIYFNSLSNVGLFTTPNVSNNMIMLDYDNVNHYLHIYCINAGSAIFSGDRAWSPSVSTWYHIEIVRYGPTGKMYVNGSQLGASFSLSSSAMPDVASTHYIGSGAGDGSWLNGIIDEFRVSKGIARHTSDFTPPIIAYGTRIKKILGVSN